MKQKIRLIILLLIPIVLLQAQDFGKITGRVVDENSGNALIGANVMVEGTSLGSATDADG